MLASNLERRDGTSSPPRKLPRNDDNVPPPGSEWQHEHADALSTMIAEQIPRFRSRPYLGCCEDLAAALRKNLEAHLQGDFCWSLNFAPRFVAALCAEGFLPICCELGGAHRSRAAEAAHRALRAPPRPAPRLAQDAPPRARLHAHVLDRLRRRDRRLPRAARRIVAVPSAPPHLRRARREGAAARAARARGRGRRRRRRKGRQRRSRRRGAAAGAAEAVKNAAASAAADADAAAAAEPERGAGDAAAAVAAAVAAAAGRARRRAARRWCRSSSGRTVSSSPANSAR